MNDIAISVGGVPIHYEVNGDGTIALVFVHGWSCDRNYWEGQVSHFAQQYKVVTIDLAGHGDSGLDRKAWTMAAFGEDVVAVISELGLEQVVLIGHSMGASVIIEAARRMPDLVIGLVAADAFKDVEQTRTEEQIAEALEPFRANFANTTRKMVHGMFPADADATLVEQVVTDISAVLPEVGIGALQEFRRNDRNLRAGLQEIKGPMVAINSDFKPTNIEGAQRYGIEISLMSGVGHFVMIEDAETFNRLLDAAVKRFVSQETC
jgi:pimeloyl-ACP methyl ester carboxylesterase